MNLSHPIESVIPSAHGPVLAVLANTDAPLTGRGVAQLVEGRVGSRRVAQVLVELTDAGLVYRTQAGAAYQYQLNRHHLAAPSIVSLANLQASLLANITAEIGRWSIPAVAVWLFGSMARGEADEGSDVDLLVICPGGVDSDDESWGEQVSRLEQCVQAWTGNRATAIEYGDAEFDKLVAANDGLVSTLREQAIHIAGETPQQRLRLSSKR